MGETQANKIIKPPQAGKAVQQPSEPEPKPTPSLATTHTKQNASKQSNRWDRFARGQGRGQGGDQVSQIGEQPLTKRKKGGGHAPNTPKTPTPLARGDNSPTELNKPSRKMRQSASVSIRIGSSRADRRGWGCGSKARQWALEKEHQRQAAKTPNSLRRKETKQRMPHSALRVPLAPCPLPLPRSHPQQS